MIGTCANCGKEDEGRTYGFYYGKLLRSVWKQRLFGDVTTSTYQATGSARVFLCDACVTKGPREASGVIAVWALMLGSFGLARGLLDAEQRLDWAVCGGAVVLGGLVALVYMLTMRKRVAAGKGTAQGERLAIEACRDDIRHRTRATEFWTTAQYKAIFDKPAKAIPALGMKSAEVAAQGAHRYRVTLSGPAYDGAPLEPGLVTASLDFDYDSPKARAAPGKCLLLLKVGEMNLDLTLERSAASTYTLRRSNQVWTVRFSLGRFTLRLDDPLSGEHCVTYSFVRG